MQYRRRLIAECQWAGRGHPVVAGDVRSWLEEHDALTDGIDEGGSDVAEKAVERS